MESDEVIYNYGAYTELLLSNIVLPSDALWCKGHFVTVICTILLQFLQNSVFNPEQHCSL